MAAGSFDFPVWDADNHLYEPVEAFTTHLPRRYRDEIRYVDIGGRTKIAVCGRISDYIPNPTFEVVARPGAHEVLYRQGNTEGKTLRELTGEPMRCPDWAREPVSRLAHMDELGIEGSLMFPTLASLLEHRMRHDVDLTHAAVHAFNEWLHDVWTFNYEDRIFATPVITLPIVDKAIEELEWVLERGARVILIRPAPVPGLRGSRGMGMEEFDPFWARVVEADVLVAMHSSDSGYNEYANDWEGNQEFLPFKPNPMRAMLQGNRPVMDTLASLVCQGAFSRFPDLKVATIEQGGSWVLPLLKQFEGVYKKMPQEFAEHPVDTLKRNLYVNPFWEEQLDEVIRTMGVDHVLFGSDYPHPEGLADPVGFAEELPAALSREERAKIMGGNLRGLLKVDRTTTV
jgi:predicted TIM-barrel fold metal-dependent hydrolase